MENHWKVMALRGRIFCHTIHYACMVRISETRSSNQLRAGYVFMVDGSGLGRNA
jgi:hypothetical protein